MSIDQQFNSINDKLQHLLKSMSRLQKENERLRIELIEAKSRESAAQYDIVQLKQQASILKYAAGELPEAEKKHFAEVYISFARWGIHRSIGPFR